MEVKNFLIVEDEPDLSAIILNMVEYFGKKGQIAENASKALNSIKHHKFDFFILDLTLPDKNGIQLYNEIIKQNPDCRGKVIFTSGLNISKELQKIIEEDGAMFLAKPFTVDKFESLLKEIG
jgi:response regulator of citrate/malate metabolism